jgi:hypothetical protein
MGSTTENLPGAREHHRGPSAPASASLPASAERLAPWLGGAIVAAIATIAALELGRGRITALETSLLLVGLGSTIAVAGLVAARASSLREATEREERARPALDQLVDQTQPAVGSAARTYVEGMEHWVIAVLELLAHASQAADDGEVRSELDSASEDTGALRSLLHDAGARQLGLNEGATLHSVCALWETSQDRIEQLAASVDPAWHRRWRARSVIERLLRHGPPQPAALVLPYR